MDSKTSMDIKICGVTTPEVAQAVADVGATHMGMVFFDRSPRHLSLSAARALAPAIPASLARVGVFVDPDERTLSEAIEVAGLTMVQLHGSETPDQVAHLRDYTGLAVIKAIPVHSARDVAAAKAYQGYADCLLFDAKPPKTGAAELPGGTGAVFDWSLLPGQVPEMPWGLSGGLNAVNVCDAIAMTGTRFVDVSSGVETAPGQKSVEMIAAFVAAVRECKA